MDKLDKSILAADVKSIVFVLTAIVIAVIWNYDEIFSSKAISEVQIVEQKSLDNIKPEIIEK